MLADVVEGLSDEEAPAADDQSGEDPGDGDAVVPWAGLAACSVAISMQIFPASWLVTFICLRVNLLLCFSCWPYCSPHDGLPLQHGSWFWLHKPYFPRSRQFHDLWRDPGCGCWHSQLWRSACACAWGCACHSAVQGWTCLLRLRDCLHAPMHPSTFGLLVLSRNAVSRFCLALMTLLSPPSSSLHPILRFPGMEIKADFHHRLSYLKCQYVIPGPPPGTVFGPAPPPLPALSVQLPSELSNISAYVANFKAPPITQDLWHRRLGHIGQDATRSVLY